MTSIQPTKRTEIACGVADDVAFELGLPWRVKDLRAEALRACRTAMQRAARSGFSSEQTYRQMRPRIKERVLKASRDMEALSPDQPELTPEQIEAALEAFTVEQWTPVERWPPIELSPPMKDWPIIEYRYGLMESVCLVEVEALISYVRQNAGDLKRRFGARKIEAIERRAIERRAIERHTELSLPDDRPKLVRISDPYWANVFPELAREANRTGKGHPAKGRSVAEELTSDRGLARHLSKHGHQVSPYQVKRWREQEGGLPYDLFDDEEDGQKRADAFIARLTRASRKYRRRS